MCSQHRFEHMHLGFTKDEGRKVIVNKDGVFIPFRTFMAGDLWMSPQSGSNQYEPSSGTTQRPQTSAGGNSIDSPLPSSGGIGC